MPSPQQATRPSTSDDFADIAQPHQQAAAPDDFADIATPSTPSGAPPPPREKGFREKVDDRIAEFSRRRTPEEVKSTLPGLAGKIDTQLEETAQNVGRRAAGFVAGGIAHPLDAIKGVYDTAKEMALAPSGHYEGPKPLEGRVKEFQDQYARSPREALENLSGDLLGMYAAGKLTDAAGKPIKAFVGPKVKAMAAPIKSLVTEKAPMGLINQLIKPMASDVKFGKNPAQAILRENIVGNSLEQLGDKVYDRAREVGKEMDDKANSPAIASTVVDVADTLKPIDTAINDAAKAGNRELVKKLSELKTEVSQDWRPFRDAKGNYTARVVGPKNLNMSPSEALEFKRQIGDRIRWDGNDPFNNDLNAVKGEIYGKLKDKVNSAVPGLKELNERYSDLVGAGKAIERRVPVASRNHAWSLSDIALGASGHLPTAIARKAFNSPAVTTRVASSLYNAGH